MKKHYLDKFHRMENMILFLCSRFVWIFIAKLFIVCIECVDGVVNFASFVGGPLLTLVGA